MGAKVLKVDCQGKLDAYGHRWMISRALAGERVYLQAVEQRVLVYYWRTLIRELDLQSHQSTAVRWVAQAFRDPARASGLRMHQKPRPSGAWTGHPCE